MSTILEADETGTLHLPLSLLPQPNPHRRYRVAAENGHLDRHRATLVARGDGARTSNRQGAKNIIQFELLFLTKDY